MSPNENDPVCSFCENEVKEEDDFCPNCGSLFTENVKCFKHHLKNAAGVCVICCNPICEECGAFVNDKIFFCAEHSDYETLEGMASILGSDVSSELDNIKSNLEREGLHPFIFSRTISSIQSAVAYEGLNIHGLQLMVPFQEVIRAEEILNELGLIE